MTSDSQMRIRDGKENKVNIVGRVRGEKIDGVCR